MNRFALPQHQLSKEQERCTHQITDRLFEAGWKEDHIREWWHTVSVKLNGHTPFEAVIHDKCELAEKQLHWTLELFHKMKRENEHAKNAN